MIKSKIALFLSMVNFASFSVIIAGRGTMLIDNRSQKTVVVIAKQSESNNIFDAKELGPNHFCYQHCKEDTVLLIQLRGQNINVSESTPGVYINNKKVSSDTSLIIEMEDDGYDLFLKEKLD